MLTQVEGVAKVTPTLFSSATKGRINHRDADCLSSFLRGERLSISQTRGLKRRDEAVAAALEERKKKFFLTSNLL